MEQQRFWRDSIYQEMKTMQLEGYRVVRACELAGVSRAGFYRHWEQTAPRELDMALRDALQRVALQHRCYGYRRVTAALNQQGWQVNHKRIARMLREDNLLSLRHRPFRLTTHSRHAFVVYPNLAGDLMVTGANQLWVSDITYIRLREMFVYLAVILDAFSRRVIGWEVGESLETQLVLRALERALAGRAIGRGIVHHSDRGIQYCAKEYVSRLLERGFAISMSRAGNPYDNALAESFMKTLKVEEVYLKDYRDLAEVRDNLQHFLEVVYNQQRLHSALGYLPPAVFESAAAGTQTWPDQVWR